MKGNRVQRKVRGILKTLQKFMLIQYGSDAKTILSVQRVLCSTTNEFPYQQQHCPEMLPATIMCLVRQKYIEDLFPGVATHASQLSIWFTIFVPRFRLSTTSDASATRHDAARIL